MNGKYASTQRIWVVSSTGRPAARAAARAGMKRLEKIVSRVRFRWFPTARASAGVCPIDNCTGLFDSLYALQSVTCTSAGRGGICESSCVMEDNALSGIPGVRVKRYAPSIWWKTG